MKIELQGIKVELETAQGKTHLVINGEIIPISRIVGMRLVFGHTIEPTVVKGKPGLAKTKPGRGCQTPSARKKLSQSLRKFYAKKRRQEAAAKKGILASKKNTNGKHLNGAAVMN